MGYGATFVLKGWTESTNNASDSISNLTIHPTSPEVTLTPGGGTPINGLRAILLDFNTTEVFAGDLVSLHGHILGDHPLKGVDGIIIMIMPRDFNFTGYTFGQLNRFIFEERAVGDLITLLPNTEPQFSTNQIMLFATEQDVYIHGFIVQGNQITQIDTQKIFHVYPTFSKLQVKTNEAILEQTAQTKKNLLAQNVSNDIVLGLTWVIVGSIPIQFGLVLRTDIWKSTFENTYKKGSQEKDATKK